MAERVFHGSVRLIMLSCYQTGTGEPLTRIKPDKPPCGAIISLSPRASMQTPARKILDLGDVHSAISARGQLINLVTDFYAREAQFVKLLKVEPKLRAGSEPVAKP